MCEKHKLGLQLVSVLGFILRTATSTTVGLPKEFAGLIEQLHLCIRYDSPCAFVTYPIAYQTGENVPLVQMTAKKKKKKTSAN